MYDGVKKQRKSEEEKTKELQGSILLRRFVPDFARAPNESSDMQIWTIMGCAEFEDDKKGIGHASSILAYWDQGRWILTPIARIMYDKANALRECRLD